MSLPSLETLASLAAAMARKTDRPEDSAKRAIHLWQACEKELHKADHTENVRAEKFNGMMETVRDETTFLSKCMGTPPDCSTPVAGETVSLQSFLTALLPNSKDETRARKWREYREYLLDSEYQLSGQRERIESDFAGKVAKWITHDEDQGLLETELLILREDFSNFHEAKGAVLRKSRADNAVRAKSIRGISKKFLAGEKLTSKDNGVLKTLLEIEIEAEIKKLEMPPAQARKWKALIQDLNAPANSRPRTIRKNGAE